MSIVNEELPWVLCDVLGVVYAISCKSVLSLNQLLKVTPLPSSPPEIRGVIDFRGRVIQLVDTRKLLNLKSNQEDINEFCAMMDARYNDHLNWITTLENSVLNKTKFTLTTDPHKCAFGKWYDSYKPLNRNVTALLKKFDAPHKAVHKLGVTVEEMINRNDHDGAITLINAVRNTELKQMVHLFEEIKQGYKESKSEISVVLGNDDHCMSITADEIVAIEHLKEIDQELLDETMTKADFIVGVGKRKNDSVVFLMSDEYILNTYSGCKVSS